MSRKITQIKVWNQNSEFRVYVTFANELRSGCYYKTGNRYHEAKSIEDMTAEELAEAKQIAVKDGKWMSVYNIDETAKHDLISAKIAQPTVKTNRIADYCIFCGKHLAIGEGSLDHLTDEEDIDHAGGKTWIVACLDTIGCQNRQAVNKAEHEAKIAAEAAKPKMTVEQEKQLWNDFFDATAYIGS